MEELDFTKSITYTLSNIFGKEVIDDAQIEQFVRLIEQGIALIMIF
ncbi:hypothetical protein [Desulfosporosinus orientis]|nr:hypothetical protein [Desulfosporosinus orientis]